MSMVLIVGLLIAGGALSWITGRWSPPLARWVALVALFAAFAPAAGMLDPSVIEVSQPGRWISQFRAPWIQAFGVSFHLAVDGLGLLMILLTLVLGVLAVLSSWTEITERVGFFHFNLLWTLAGVAGVFAAMDLFLFYFFWELMLVPMYFLIGIWGHENRRYASFKFFLFTQASGLLMLLSIVALAYAHYQSTGALTFDYPTLLGSRIEPEAAFWLMLGFFVAFAVKLPAVPLHTWLPDAHTEAPTAGSLILAGLLLKTGAYGIIRFAVPLFPEASLAFAPVAMILGAIGVLYGAWLAFAQTDLKRLVAYTSVSHLGFVLLGVYAFDALGLQGAILEMICHGLSTGGLFVLAGVIQERLHTRDLRRMGGLAKQGPRMGAVALVLALASLGLPGLGNFIAEFLVLAGTYRRSVPIAAVATLGLVVATVYSVVFFQRVFQGRPSEPWVLRDLSAREISIFAVAIALLIWLGLYPQPVLDAAETLVAVTSAFGGGKG